MKIQQLGLGVVVLLGMLTVHALEPMNKNSTIKKKGIQKVSLPANSINFDLKVIPFSETPLGREMAKKGKTVEGLVDRWGYPVLPKNSSRLNPPKSKSILKKLDSSNLKDFIQGMMIRQSNAYQVVNAQGDVNCRSNNQSGYFKVHFEDVELNTDQGFDHPSLGVSRQQAFCAVAESIATMIKLEQTTLKPDILLPANLPPSYPSQAIAAASSAYYNLTDQDSGTLHRHIVRRIDPTPAAGLYDASVYIDWTKKFTMEYPGDPQAFDFNTVMYHEIFHAMGFASRMDSTVSTTGIVKNHGHFDEHLYHINSTPAQRYFSFTALLSPLIQVPTGSPPSWFISDQAVYNGKKNHIAATLDGIRPIYSPQNWEQGSHLSHFDMTRASGEIYVMNPSLPPLTIRPVHNHEKEVLCHMGYQVAGMSDCESPTPVAYDDQATLTNSFGQLSPACVPLLNNDVSFSAGTLSVDTMELLTPAAGVSFQFDTGSSSCASANWVSGTLANATGARKIRVTSSNGTPIVLKYRIRDSVSGRISNSAVINLSNCNNSADQYVCNGDFEMGFLPPAPNNVAANAFFMIGRVPGWSAGQNSPDLVFKNYPGTNNSIWNLPANNNNGLPPSMLTNLNMVDQGQFAAWMAATPTNNEQITTQLKMPLTVGDSYLIEFDVAHFFPDGYQGSTPPITSASTRAALATSSMSISNSNPFPTQNATVVLDQMTNVPPNGPLQWTHVSQVFTAAQAFQYLVIYAPLPPGYYTYFYVDNVSIKKHVPVGTNKISGTVYFDSNANGARNNGEQGSNGVTVGLFDSTTANPLVPIQTVVTQTHTVGNVTDLGYYSFPTQGNTLNPTVNYRVAIVPENSVATITEPATNNLMVPYQHAKAVSLANGPAVNQNFGILISGQPLPVHFTVQTSTQYFCTDVLAQITASVTSSNGSTSTSGYTFTWTGPSGPISGATGPTLQVTAPGNYSVTVTASNGTSVGPIPTTVDNVPNTLLNSVYTGNYSGINLTVTGANPFTYSWTGPGGFSSTQEDLTGLSPGTYTVNVTNQYGCVSQYPFNLSPILLSHNKKEGCSNLDNSINLDVTGGTGNYTYLWTSSNGNYSFTGQDPVGIPPGTYTVTVTDSSSQVATTQVTIAAYTPMTLTYQMTPAIPPASNGALTVTVSGGTPQYTYQWSNGVINGPTNSTSNSIGNLPASNSTTYSVSVTDSRKCVVRQVDMKVRPKLNASVIHALNCKEKPFKNTAFVLASGGIPPYSYQWTQNGANVSNTTNVLSGFAWPSGNYQVTVTDSVGQVLNLPVILSSTPLPHPSISGSVTDSVLNQSNGTINAVISGELAPYLYNWNPGTGGSTVNTTLTRTGLSPGIYHLSVATSLKCKMSKSFTVKAIAKPADSKY